MRGISSLIQQPGIGSDQEQNVSPLDCMGKKKKKKKREGSVTPRLNMKE